RIVHEELQGSADIPHARAARADAAARLRDDAEREADWRADVDPEPQPASPRDRARASRSDPPRLRRAVDARDARDRRGSRARRDAALRARARARLTEIGV